MKSLTLLNLSPEKYRTRHESKSTSKVQPTITEQPDVTPREIEILKMLAEGFSTREISYQLYISAHTVHTHRKNMQAKLGVKNVAHLIHYTWQRGWFSEYAVSV